MELKNYFTTDASGEILPFATCFLYEPGTQVLVAGIVDKNGNPMPNPFIAANNGLMQFAAPNGPYDLRVTASNRDYTLRIQCADVASIVSEVEAAADRAAVATAPFLPPSATAPTTRADGSPVQIGDRYLNTSDNIEYILRSDGWGAAGVDPATLAGPDGATLVGNGDSTVAEALTARPTAVALATGTGAAGVGYQSSIPGATLTNTAALLGLQVFPETFSQIVDYNLDVTDILRAVITEVGRSGGGTVMLATGHKYRVTGMNIIIPEWVTLDLNGNTIIGNRNDTAGGSTFISGYFDTSGTLVSNLASPIEQRMLDGIQVRNGKFQNIYRPIKFRNTNRTCAIENISFINCAQSWELSRPFSMKLENIFSSDGSLDTLPTYSFVDGAINSIVLNQVRAVTGWGFSFVGGCDSVVFINCDYEGGLRGFHFEGVCRGVRWVGGYFENVPGILFDLAYVTDGSFSWSGTYNWLIDTLIAEPFTPGATIEGVWDETNSILIPGFVEAGHTFNQWIYLRGAGNHLKVRLQGTVSSPAATIPYFVVTDGNPSANVTQEGPTGTGRLALKSKGLVPVRFGGDVGPDTANSVTNCTHQHFNPGTPNIVIFVDTTIRYRESMFLKYRFSVTDANATYKLAGDIYGDIVKPADAVGKVVELSQLPSGMVRLALYGYTHPTGVYTCTGAVQLLC